MKIQEVMGNVTYDSKVLDDPDANLADAAYQQSLIQPSYGSIKLSTEGNMLVFESGRFDALMLKHLIMPTMKGLWVPIKVEANANLLLDFQLIGLKNCSPDIKGRISLGSEKLLSFDTIPIKTIDRFSIADSHNLTDLSKMPKVSSQLSLNAKQVENNIHYIVNACSKDINVFVYGYRGRAQSTADTLEHLLTEAIRSKTGNNRAAIFQLQQNLIDCDLEEYSHLGTHQ